MRWEVVRCAQILRDEEHYRTPPEDARACGIREVATGGGFGRMIVADTNRDECCHHMWLKDANEIVEAHNLKEEFIERASNTIIERERTQLQKLLDGVDAVVAPVPHSTLDAVALGLPRPSPEEIERQERAREKRKRDLAGDFVPTHVAMMERGPELGGYVRRPDSTRDTRQEIIGERARVAFGDEEALSIPQRALRVLEEAVELAQACDVDPLLVHKLARYVYGREKGEVKQEVGGLSITLLALGHAGGFSVDSCERSEYERVVSKEPSYFTERNKLKNAAGLNVKEKSDGTD